MQTISYSFIDGMNAYRNGKSIHYNPYRNRDVSHSKAFNDWDDGWKAARKRDESAELITQYENPWFKVEKQKGFHWAAGSKAGGAVVLPITKDNKVICIRIHRPSINRVSLELPRGGLELSDANSIETARRELREETGADVPADRFFHLGNIAADTGLLRGIAPAFMALVEESDFTAERDHEAEDVLVLPWEEFANKIASGEVICGITLSAVALYRSANL